MMKRTIRLAAVLALTCLSAAGAARADELIEAYDAHIGEDDLYNSSNERLKQPWQIIRQDRANYHRFGIRQRGDEGDGFFASAKNRELAERMIRRGTISRSAARALVAGDVDIRVEIYRGRNGDYINVTVY